MERYPTKRFDRTKACHVCGRELLLYVRICDRCGSIQRPVSGDGMPVPPEAMVACKNCGRQYVKEENTGSENLCPDCDAILNPSKKRLSSLARERITYITVGAFMAASVVAVFWVIVAQASAMMMTGVLAAAGLVLIIGASTLAFLITNKRRRIRPRVQPDLEEADEDYLP